MQVTIFNKYIFSGHWADLLCTMQHCNLQYRILNKYVSKAGGFFNV